MSIDFSSILPLLGAYYIPAQSIERIVEYWTKTPHYLEKRKEMTFYQSQIESFKKIRDQVISTSVSSDPTFIKDPQKFYNDKVKNIDDEIGTASQKSDNADTVFAVRMWERATCMAVVPGALFAFFGLGILQMTSPSIPSDSHNMYIVFDAILNALFIGSGTKPIHDAIDVISGSGKKKNSEKN